MSTDFLYGWLEILWVRETIHSENIKRFDGSLYVCTSNNFERFAPLSLLLQTQLLNLYGPFWEARKTSYH